MTGREIYPGRDDLAKLKFWRCPECGAYVGTHRNSRQHAAKGDLANAETRALRREAHRLFDPLWRDGEMTRAEAYQWLADQLRSTGKVHIGFSDDDRLRKIITLVKEKRGE